RMFFANAEHIAEKVRRMAEEVKPSVVAMDLSAVPDLEYTALKALMEAEKRQRARGVRVWLVGLNPGGLGIVQKSPLGEALGREALHFNLEGAVAKFQGI